MSKNTKKRTPASKPNAKESILISIAGKAIGQFLFDLWREYFPASWLQDWLPA